MVNGKLSKYDAKAMSTWTFDCVNKAPSVAIAKTKDRKEIVKVGLNLDHRSYFANQASWAIQKLLVDIMTGNFKLNQPYKMDMSWGMKKITQFTPNEDNLCIFANADFMKEIRDL